MSASRSQTQSMKGDTPVVSINSVRLAKNGMLSQLHAQLTATIDDRGQTWTDLAWPLLVQLRSKRWVRRNGQIGMNANSSAFAGLLGVQYPVFVAEGPRSSIDAITSSVATISNMGGVGVIDAGVTDTSELESMIALVREQTNRPFAVYLPGPVARMGRQLFDIISCDYPQHVAYVTKLKYELCQAFGRKPMQQEFDADRLIGVVQDLSVPIAIVGRECPPDLVGELSADSKTVAVAISIDNASMLARHGADAIIPSHRAMNLHDDEETYLDAFDRFVDRGPNIPLVAASIFGADDIGVALNHGASGVWTRRWPSVEEREAARNINPRDLARSIEAAWSTSGLDPLPKRLQETMLVEIEASLMRFDNTPVSEAPANDDRDDQMFAADAFFSEIAQPMFSQLDDVQPGAPRSMPYRDHPDRA